MSDESNTVAPAEEIAGPDFWYEKRAGRRGGKIVAGCDEAGRGPLAGPVVAAAVILNRRKVPEGLNDSKQLTENAREELFAEIMATSTVAVVAAPPTLIMRLNILWASMWAMEQAVKSLSLAPDYVLVDGNTKPKHMPCTVECVVDGDALSLSIAAASIVAKVTRDRMCRIMHCDEPHFGFDGHKGYSTPEHFEALVQHGPGRHHRMDFAPCLAAAGTLQGELDFLNPTA